MLSERQLQNLLKAFDKRMQGVTDEYLTRIGEHIRDIGKLSDSDINRLVQMKRLNQNLESIKRAIAKAAGKNIRDIERVFEAVAESDYRFAAATFGEDHTPRVKDNKPLERIIKAQLRITAQEFKNLSQTTILSDAYREAVDVAVQTVQAGLTDYNSAIRKAFKQAAREGLRVEYPNSGLTRRLDTAARQNILDGVRSISQDTLNQAGKEFGADGVEISAHALCALDHLPYQGRQYSNRDFERIQNTLERPFGMWNCKHITFPILIGISQPAHTEEELQSYIRNSNEEITIDGRTMSRYEWTQHQRKLETAIRYQKDIAVAAKASGDMILRRDAQANINRIRSEYSKISAAAGLYEKPERMTVAGFRAVKTADQLKSVEKYGTINTKTNGTRGMSNGARTSRLHILTESEIESVKRDAKSLKIPVSVLRFNEGFSTSFVDKLGIITIRGDVLPDLSSHVLRDRLTQKAVLAHEYYGHYKSHPSKFDFDDWRDEFSASYNAATTAPGLSDEERRELMLDAFDRAKEAGVSAKYNKTARRYIYGED